MKAASLFRSPVYAYDNRVSDLERDRPDMQDFDIAFGQVDAPRHSRCEPPYCRMRR
jgi:hypothetical protein